MFPLRRVRRWDRAFISLPLVLSAMWVSRTAVGSEEAAIIPIVGPITDITRDSLDRRVDEAIADGAKVIVFELDTPGGMVTSSLDICSTIKNLPTDVRSVAWIHDDALSAGAMIAVACHEIVVAKSVRFGDCAPIMVDPAGGLTEMPPAERAKMESPILQEFRDSAVRNGFDPLLCRAMVTVGQEVWWLEDAESGQREFVGPEEKKRRIDDQPDGPWKLVSSFELDGHTYPVEQPIDRGDALLTMTQAEARAYGFAHAVAGDEVTLRDVLQLSRLPSRIEVNGWEQFASWLNSPMIRGLLMVVFLLAGYMELQSPGVILPGIVALVALGIFLAAPYAAGLADVWTIVLLVLGLGLLAVEVFLLPGFGIAGVLGFLLVLGSLLGTFVPSEPNTPWFSMPKLQGTWDALHDGVLVMASSMVISVIGILLLLTYGQHIPLVKRVLLANPEPIPTGPVPPPRADLLPGDIGVVTGALRPGGQARFGHEIYDVSSQGEYVDAGARVQVMRHQGHTIVVRPLPTDV
ncbi:MAG: hypothetical protein KDA32_11985 [Phycisphaerales bacterium]|nr:hypothetical protein [Phycisphaerales bacterium]